MRAGSRFGTGVQSSFGYGSLSEHPDMKNFQKMIDKKIAMEKLAFDQQLKTVKPIVFHEAL